MPALPGSFQPADTARPEAAPLVPELPVFSGIRRDFGEFLRLADGHGCDVVAGGPAWMFATTPACFAHLKNGNSSIVILAVAPGGVPEPARPALVRVWCMILANLDVETPAGDLRVGNAGAEPKRRRKRREKYVADAKPHSAATSRWVMEVEQSRWQARESRVSSMRSRIVFQVAWNRRSVCRRLVPIAAATVETTVVSERDSIPGSPMTEKSRQSAAGSGTG